MVIIRDLSGITRRLREMCILATCCSLTAFAFAVEPRTVDASSATTNSAAKVTPRTPTSPFWNELTHVQQQALAPLAPEWDKLDGIRKKKWLEISGKFGQMKPEEQQRMQERMREWIKMTPEQRRVARESYARAKKLPPEQKAVKWEEYQQLSNEQKQKLAAEVAGKKKVATPPSPQTKHRPVAPIKSTPKPVLEQSITPQATNQAVIQPSVPATNAPTDASANN